MKFIFLAAFLTLMISADGQISIDSLYLETDSLFKEELVNADDYILEENVIWGCPFGPTLPGGLDSLHNYIQAKIDSATISETNVGDVWILFTIDESGYFQGVQAIRGIDMKIDTTCVKVIEQIRKWSPAQDSNGKDIASWGYYLRFRVGKKD